MYPVRPDPIAMEMPNLFTGMVDGDYRNRPERSIKRRSDNEQPPAMINWIRPDFSGIDTHTNVVRAFGMESLRAPMRRRPANVL
jgi:hypothetical protein